MKNHDWQPYLLQPDLWSACLNCGLRWKRSNWGAKAGYYRLRRGPRGGRLPNEYLGIEQPDCPGTGEFEFLPQRFTRRQYRKWRRILKGNP